MSNRPIGGIFQTDEFESIINNSNYSKYDESEISNMSNNHHEMNEMSNFNEDDFALSIHKMNQLIDINEGLNEQIQYKFKQLELNNNELDEALKFLKIPNIGDEFNNVYNINDTYQKNNDDYNNKSKRYLPTPTYDEFPNDDEMNHIGINDIPSSPDIMPFEEFQDDDLNEVEIELNDKISRMVQINYQDGNIIKLKNVVNSTLDLLKFKYEQDDMKLMNIDENVKIKSGKLMEKLYGLVESFT